VFLEENGQLSYIKPQNYEISKTRKYRQDIGRRENMTFMQHRQASAAGPRKTDQEPERICEHSNDL
jgi:hypothetical protein